MTCSVLYMIQFLHLHHTHSFTGFKNWVSECWQRRGYGAACQHSAQGGFLETPHLHQTVDEWLCCVLWTWLERREVTEQQIKRRRVSVNKSDLSTWTTTMSSCSPNTRRIYSRLLIRSEQKWIIDRHHIYNAASLNRHHFLYLMWFNIFTFS